MEELMSARGHQIRKAAKAYLKSNIENHFDDVQFIHFDTELHLYSKIGTKNMLVQDNARLKQDKDRLTNQLN